jgi:hypothetical protein
VRKQLGPTMSRPVSVNNAAGGCNGQPGGTPRHHRTATVADRRQPLGSGAPVAVDRDGSDVAGPVDVYASRSGNLYRFPTFRSASRAPRSALPERAHQLRFARASTDDH